MSQIFLHLITGDPTIPHGASSRRSHGEQNHVGDPKRPNWCLSDWIFLLRWTSTGQAHPPHSHTGGRSSTTAQQSTSSPQVHPSSFPIFSSFQAHTSFFNYLTSGSAKLKVPREPQYCAYALLGPHYCPLSYFGSPDFWPSLKSSATPLPFSDQALSFQLTQAQLVVKYSFRHSCICSCEKMLFWCTDIWKING